jgi:dTDP-4-dehydrorhamnose 3,5-epimerase
MRFIAAKIPGAFVIEPEQLADERGFFARTWSDREFAEHGLNPTLVQCSISFNLCAGTLRGMHYQAPPHAEAKLVRCTRGAIHDVIVDLRESSPTFLGHFACELTMENRRMLYIPEGLAHGYQTLEDASEVFYQMSADYAPTHARGVRWDDPRFGIVWPAAAERIINARDRGYPDFVPDFVPGARA